VHAIDQHVDHREPLRASVVIGVHNRWGALERCLDSLLASNERSFEIVVVDDASTDDTRQRIEEYAEKNDQTDIQIVHLPENLGAAGARTAGIRHARGTIVCFIDSDCTVKADWLDQVLAAFEDGQVGAVSGMVIDECRSNLFERAFAGETRYDRKPHTLIETNMAMRRELAEKYSFDTVLVYGGEGDDVAWRLRRAGWKLGFARRAVVHHYHPLGMTAFLSRGFRQAIGSGRYWFKHRQYLGRDVVFAFLALATLPLGLIDWRLLAAPGLFAALQLAAIAWNEWYHKQKNLLEVIYVYPACLLFYAARIAGIVCFWLRLIAGLERPVWISRQRKQKTEC